MVKCAFCKKELDKKVAYAVKSGKRNKYYCNYEHSIAKPPRDEMYEQLNIVFGKTITSSVLYQEFDKIIEAHTVEKVLAYIKENYQYLCMVMCKDFVSDYARIRYLAAVFKNNLGDFEMPKVEVKKEMGVDSFDFASTRRKNNKKKSMNEIVGELIE